MSISDAMAKALSRIADIEARVADFAPPPPPPDGQAAFQQYLALQPGLRGASAPGVGRGRMAPPELEGLIQSAAEEEGVRPELLRAVIQAESGFNPRATSPRGAMGLMQLMPGTAAALGVSDPYAPAENIRGGARYLRQQLDRFGGDERLALAAYNAGPGAVQRYHGVPPYPETQQYVERVLSFSEQGADW